MWKDVEIQKILYTFTVYRKSVKVPVYTSTDTDNNVSVWSSRYFFDNYRYTLFDKQTAFVLNRVRCGK